MWRRLWHDQHTLGHFQSVLHIQGLIAVEGKHASSRQGAEKARKLYSLSIYDKPPVTQGASQLAGKNSDQRNHFLPPSLTCRQSGQMNLGYLPTPLWFRRLSLPGVSIGRSGFCPPPFSFSFLLKLSACDFHGRTKIPERQFCPRTVPALLLSPKRAPLLPRETEKEQVLSGIWMSGPSEL